MYIFDEKKIETVNKKQTKNFTTQLSDIIQIVKIVWDNNNCTIL